jgi:hypothetical protein
MRKVAGGVWRRGSALQEIFSTQSVLDVEGKRI